MMTERMTEVLERIARGKKNHEIAAELGISEKTIEKHRAALYAEFQVDNAVSLVVAAHRQRVIKL